MGDPTAQYADPPAAQHAAAHDLTTLQVADEFARAAYGGRYAAAAPGIPYALVDGLRGLAAALDQLGRLTYCDALALPAPDPRVAPGFVAERVYGPAARSDDPHFDPRPERADTPLPDDGEAARAARAVIEAAALIGAVADRAAEPELVSRLLRTPDGRLALQLLAQHFSGGDR
jgi:hypothetical protein